jgi:type II secretory pathway pseudopilin PulG
MQKRAAIGLSINMIVMIIISIVILASGIVLLRSFVTGADDIKNQLDQRTQDRLSELLTDQGKTVAFPFYTKNIRRGDSHVYGIGISNIQNVPVTFTLIIDTIKFIDSSGQEFNRGNSVFNFFDWARWDREPFTIREGDIVKKTILVKVPKNANPGTYVFNARVSYIDENGENQAYGAKQDFFAIVG